MLHLDAQDLGRSGEILIAIFYPDMERIKGMCLQGEQVENYNFMGMVETSGFWQFQQAHSRLIHSSQFHEPLQQGRIWASSSDFENSGCSRPEMSVYIVNCYGSYNKNLLKAIKHSSLYVYYFSLLFVDRHGSFDVNYHHTWHFMQ